MYRIVFISFLMLLLSCAAKQQVQDEPTTQQEAGMMVSLTDAQIKTAGIDTGRPEKRLMNAVLKVNGVVEAPPQNWVSVSFPLGGYLKSTSLLPGMRVAKGQVIAVMEDQAYVQLQQDYLMAQAKLAFLQKEYERQKLLNETKTTSDKVFEQTASQYQSEKIVAQSLRQKLLLIGLNPDRLNENTISRTVNIYAPITGYVSAVNVNRGRYVNPTDVLFELVNPDKLHLMLTVFEKDLPQIQPGQKVNAYLTSDTGKTYEAKVKLVSKNLDANRSALVHCDFTGATPPLLPGVFMNAEVQVKAHSSIAVPEEAVVRSEDKEYVFLRHGDRQFEMVPVSTGINEAGFIEINSADTDLLQQILITKNAYAALMKLQNKSEE